VAFSRAAACVSERSSAQEPSSARSTSCAALFATLAEFEAHLAVPCLETLNLALSRQVDEVDRDGAVARSKADAPEIDGVVRIDDRQKLKPGQFAEVDIVHVDEHDLAARLAS
jgi:hypothetical protein